MNLLAAIDSRVWVLVALGIITILYAVMRNPFGKKDPLSRAPKFASLAQQRSVERQMQNVLVELSEMTRQISAQLDTRAGKLEALMKEADEKIAALKAMSASGPAMTPPSAASLASSSQPMATPASSLDPRHAQVYALADQGRSSREIAQQLQRPSGEVELILALRK